MIWDSYVFSTACSIPMSTCWLRSTQDACACTTHMVGLRSYEWVWGRSCARSYPAYLMTPAFSTITCMELLPFDFRKVLHGNLCVYYGADDLGSIQVYMYKILCTWPSGKVWHCMHRSFEQSWCAKRFVRVLGYDPIPATGTPCTASLLNCFSPSMCEMDCFSKCC